VRILLGCEVDKITKDSFGWMDFILISTLYQTACVV
jgi:hypothetical protein